MKYNELNPDQKEKARNKIREFNTSTTHETFEWICEAFKEDCRLIGLEITDYNYCISHSQGDGASFAGYLDHVRLPPEQVKALPYWLQPYYQRLEEARIELFQYLATDPHQFIEDGDYSSLKHCYDFALSYAVRLGSSCRYQNEMSMFFDGSTEDMPEKLDSDLLDLLREMAQELHKRLESEDLYRNSDETIEDDIEANEYDFTPSASIDSILI